MGYNVVQRVFDGSIECLSSHPNYRKTRPKPGESAIAYALRTAAHLVSPPKLPDETRVRRVRGQPPLNPAFAGSVNHLDLCSTCGHIFCLDHALKEK